LYRLGADFSSAILFSAKFIFPGNIPPPENISAPVFAAVLPGFCAFPPLILDSPAGSWYPSYKEISAACRTLFRRGTAHSLFFFCEDILL
jgi:hypothetical protein